MEPPHRRNRNHLSHGTRKDSGKRLQISLIHLYSFGTGISRPQKKIPDWPGPAHGYKVKQKPSFIGHHNRQVSSPKSTKIEIDEGFQHYYIKTATMSPRFSFGTGVGSALMNSERRPLPRHLRGEKKSPGPGYYESQSSIQTVRRDMGSLQDSTWQKVHGGGYIDIPKNNPGPGNYSPNRTADDLHKPRSLEPGYCFQLGPKDSMGQTVSRNRNPGPGTHEHIGLHTHSFNKVLRGEMEPKYPEDKSVPIVDNGVPGPGTYDPNDHLPVPNFKISQASPSTKQYKEWEENTSIKNPVGPNTYYPQGHPDWQ